MKPVDINIRRRAFGGETDVQAMMALSRAFSADNLHVVDLPYRLSSWALDDPGNIVLWVDAGGQLVAWAVMQTPFWTVDYACHPTGGSDLNRQVLDWADQRARQALHTASGRPCWFVTPFATQTERIRDLERAGFACQSDVGEDSWSKVLMQRRALMPVAERTLPGGFAIRPLAGENEIEAYVQLHRAAFGSENMTPEWRARVLRRPEHRPELDLVATAPDGQLAAFCISWLHRGSGGQCSGQIEPLGVHEDYRGLGLGRAILGEALRRLHCCGADTVYVETDLQRTEALSLYKAMGFRVLQDVWVYRKDYADTRGSR